MYMYRIVECPLGYRLNAVVNRPGQFVPLANEFFWGKHAFSRTFLCVSRICSKFE